MSTHKHQFGWEMRGQRFSIPDVIGEIVAFRCWQYNLGGRGYLCSIHKPMEWNPQALSPAHCEKWAIHPYSKSPCSSCTCGIYGLKSLDYDYLYEHNYHDAPCWGLVALSGRIIEGEKGYRAEYARPLHVWADPSRISPEKQALISVIYDIPVHVWSEKRGYSIISYDDHDHWHRHYSRLLQGGGEEDGDRRDDQGVHDRADPGAAA